MTTETLRLTASAFQTRAVALWERVLRLGRRAPRRLRLCESLPLGERRFVAVVEFDAARFLVGGTPSSLVLLSRLADDDRSAAEDPEQDKSSNAAKAAGKRRGDLC